MQELPDDLRPTSVICHPDTVTLETHGPDMAELLPLIGEAEARARLAAASGQG